MIRPYPPLKNFAETNFPESWKPRQMVCYSITRIFS